MNIETPEEKARRYASYVPNTWITMSDATQCIGGTSGRANPKLVKLIEALAGLGLLDIVQVDKRCRQVRRNASVPAMSPSVDIPS